MRHRQTAFRLTGCALCTLLLAPAMQGCGAGAGARTSATRKPTALTQARAASKRFLDRYVDADGRVVRRDQGADTASEGQAYAMLISVAIGDQRRFDRIWSWTSTHLARPDGLLSWHWSGGSIVDGQPATDGDLDAAHALALAARRFGRARHRVAAARMARAVLALETASVAAEPAPRVLVAGPWAVSDRVLNPSYVSPRAYDVLAATGAGATWARMRQQDVAIVQTLVAGARLPPDWARAPGGGAPVTAIAPPTQASEQPRYGFDAARVPIRLGSSCDAASRSIAASLLPLLRSNPQLLPRGLDGAPLPGAVPTPVALVGAAGAAHAAGDRAMVASTLDQASAMDRGAPTYYGSAWVALGRILLTTSLLGSCAQAG